MHIVCQYIMICRELFTSPYNQTCSSPPVLVYAADGNEGKRINESSSPQKEMHLTSSGASLFVGC